MKGADNLAEHADEECPSLPFLTFPQGREMRLREIGRFEREPLRSAHSTLVVVKGLCQGLVLSDYVSLVVDGVYVKLFSTTSGAPFVRLWFNGNWFPVMAVI